LRRRGSALLLVVLAMVALAVLAKAFVAVSHGRAFGARQEHQRLQLQYLAETGLAQVRDALARDPEWRVGLPSTRMEGVPGSYRAQVTNNLAGDDPADGPRGALTVPPHAADIVVTAELNGVERRYEGVLTRANSTLPPFAVAASERVTLRGSVRVEGVTGVDEQPTPAGIHSNGDLAGPVISWRPNETGERARVSGNVSTVSTAADAIDFGSDPGALSVGGFQRGAPHHPLPYVDVPGELARHLDHAPPAGASLVAGRFSQRGDMSVDGDLQLDGTALYVEGNLRVNGTIRGTGSVYVGGTTTFQGDSRLKASESGVALYAHGDVELRGFDGTQYLERLGQDDPAALAALQELQRCFEVVSDVAAAAQNLPEVCPDESLALYTRLGTALDTLQSSDALPTMRATVETLPPGETRDFVMKRLDGLMPFIYPNPRTEALVDSLWSDFNQRWLPAGMDPARWGAMGASEQRSALGEARYRRLFTADPLRILGTLEVGGARSPAVRGIYSDRQNQWQRRLLQVLSRTLLRRANPYRLGTSYFQGLMYSHGRIHASHEVDVLGMVWAREVQLDDGTALVWQRDLAQANGGYFGGGPPVVAAWWEL